MSEIKVDTLTGKTTAKTVTVTVGATATQSLEQGLAKAWWYYDQTNSTNRGSFNVSSIADTTEGQYNPTVVTHFTNIYAVLSGATARTGISKLSGISGATMTSTNTFQCYTTDAGSGTSSDTESCGVAHGVLV